MGRKPPDIKVEVIYNTSDDPHALARFMRATQILMRIQARIDKQRAADANMAAAQPNEDEIMDKPSPDISLHRSPMPFDSYPEQGRALLGRVKGSNCRHEYGLKFMRVTGQMCCAYCGLDFAASYQNWLQMALDHVVPAKTGMANCIPEAWLDDSSNKVIACAACNGFCNRYELALNDVCPAALDEFFELRDRVFTERKALVMERHQRERAFFEKKPWLPK